MSSDCNIGLPEYFVMQQPWNLRTHMQVQPSPAIGGVSTFGENFSVVSLEQPEPSIEIRNTLQSMVKSDFCGKQYYNHKYSEGSYRNPCTNLVGSKVLPQEQIKLLRDDAATGGRNFEASFDEIQDHRLNITSRQERQSPRFSLGSVSVSSGGSFSSRPVLSNKPQIRWTQDLHELKSDGLKILILVVLMF